MRGTQDAAPAWPRRAEADRTADLVPATDENEASRSGLGGPARRLLSSSAPGASSSLTPVAATPGERQPRALASHREPGCEQAPRRVWATTESRGRRRAGPSTARRCAPLANGRCAATRGPRLAFTAARVSRVPVPWLLMCPDAVARTPRSHRHEKRSGLCGASRHGSPVSKRRPQTGRRRAAVL